jgi:hypothetical protein
MNNSEESNTLPQYYSPSNNCFLSILSLLDLFHTSNCLSSTASINESTIPSALDFPPELRRVMGWFDVAGQRTLEDARKYTALSREIVEEARRVKRSGSLSDEELHQAWGRVINQNRNK